MCSSKYTVKKMKIQLDKIFLTDNLGKEPVSRICKEFSKLGNNTKAILKSRQIFEQRRYTNKWQIST